MIKYIAPGSGISVTGGRSNPYISPGSQSAGMLRYNVNMNNTEVYDGNSWVTISSDVNISLTPDVQEVVAWAKLKMQEEKKLEQLLNKHVGLKDLHEKFELMKTLCQTDEENAAR